MLTTTNAVGSSSNAYVNWKTTVTDPNGNKKDLYHDAYGNLVQVGEHNGTSTYSTYYTYDGLKDLTNLTDALGNVRNFTYDGLGRMVSSTDLHASTDTTYGTWNFTYDNAGNLTSRVDPKSQTVNYTYDGINRVLTEDYTGATGTEVMYTYDTCTNGIGRLCTVSSTDAVSLDTKSYDPLGNLASETKTINGTAYATSYTYDRQGNQLTITNPDNSVIEYTYGTGGLVNEVLQKPSGGSFTAVVNNLDYSPTDQPAVIAYANGVNATNTYNPSQLYRLTQKLSVLPGGGGNAQNIAYTYDADGNITQIVDTSNSGTGRTVNYTYDNLSRLTLASTTNVSTTPSYAQAFGYDALGNIVSGPSGTYSYAGNTGSSYADPDAVTSISLSVTTTTPVAFDASSSFNPTVASTTFAFPLTVTSTANRALIVGITALSSINTSTGASYNGVAMTQIADVSYPGGVERLTLWYLQNPASGTHNVSTTVFSATANVIPAAVSFANTSGIGNVATSAVSGATSSVSITSSLGNMIADFISFAEPTTSTIPSVKSGQTLLMASTTSVIARAGGMAYIAATSSAAITNQWSAPTEPDSAAGDVELVAATTTMTASTTFAYDNNGNLTSGNGFTYAWDYNNRLLSASSSNSTSSYGYDYTGQRVEVVSATSTTYYPETTYSVNGTTRTKHIFADGLLLATIQNSSNTGAPLAFDAASSFNPTVASTTFAFPLTVTSTANRALVVGITALSSINTSTGASYNGVAMTQIGDVSYPGGVERLTLWYLQNPASGTHNVSTTVFSATANVIPAAVSFANTSGLGNVATSAVSGATSSVSITSSLGNMIADFISFAEPTTSTIPSVKSGQKLLMATTTSVIARAGGMAYIAATSSASITNQWSAPTEPDSVAGDVELVAAVPTVISYVLDDNLGGTNVVTNASGSIVEALDYYPYGQARMDTTSGGYAGEVRKYIGQVYDAPTQLLYLNARYYNANQGQFISQDPVFLGNPSQQNLSNPQTLNAYSYSEDNPITGADPSGKLSLAQVSATLSQISAALQSISNILSHVGGSSFAGQVAQATYQGVTTAAGTIAHTSQATYNAVVNNPVLVTAGAAAVAAGALSEGNSTPAQDICGEYCPEAEQEVLKVGKSFGNLGTVANGYPSQISGFSSANNYHAIDQVITRSVSPQTLMNTVSNPGVVLSQANGNFLYLTNEAGVVLNQAGQVVTAYLAPFYSNIQSIINLIK